ncbi:MAG: DsrE family protein [Burkholderiales bacterium]|jgi:sulfur relay (sulfurtransferase) complex TusBCD TusD component (DsrE family)|nr:DsrE family protein [Burkholderiales bacterium]MBP7520614.1 DsrE family protein [Leptothrix sp. (in: b-proteobacteria)]HQY07381.1 DsrE family protein [Burkholderiaceae bacterium]
MKKSLLVASLLSCAALVARADELFVSIHSAGAMAQGAGLVLAGQALEQKVPVRVLLCDAAGDVALQGQEMPALKPRNVTPQQLLKNLLAAGAKVEVCALYLPNRGRLPTDLLAGVAPAKPADVAAHLMKPGVRTLAF